MKESMIADSYYMYDITSMLIVSNITCMAHETSSSVSCTFYYPTEIYDHKCENYITEW